jgi:hypothetical protein
MDVEITVIDDSDIVGWSASATREGEVYMDDVESMVSNILRALRVYARTCNPLVSPYNRMSRLNILDHGNSSTIQIGSDGVSIATLPKFKATLALLAGKFSDSGFVHLQHCDAGQNRPLLLELAKTFGVPVYAGTGAHNPVYRFNTGQYVRADPDGTFHSSVGRP